MPTATAAAKLLQSCPTLCDPKDGSLHPPGSSIHRIFQARILEWVAIAFTVTCPLDPYKFYDYNRFLGIQRINLLVSGVYASYQDLQSVQLLLGLPNQYTVINMRSIWYSVRYSDSQGHFVLYYDRGQSRKLTWPWEENKNMYCWMLHMSATVSNSPFL